VFHAHLRICTQGYARGRAGRRDWQ
jgi:hypothetical protein